MTKAGLSRLISVVLVLRTAIVLGETPISLASTGHAVVPIEIEGHPSVTFVFDTGADQTVLYRHFADELGLAALGRDSLQGQTGTTDVPVVRMPRFSVDGRSFAARDTIVLPDRADGVRLNGILGLDVMRDYVADVDYPRARLTLHASGTDPRTLMSAAAVPVAVERVAGDLMAFTVTINGVRGTAILDSGSRDTRLNTRFAMAAGVPLSEGAGHGEPIFGATNSALAATAVVLREFVVAGHTMVDFEARAVDLPVFAEFGVADRPALILGFDTLRSARVVIDGASNTVWFEWSANRPVP
jgi:predicted aspartyl protease